MKYPYKNVLKLAARLAILYLFILIMDTALYTHTWSWSLPAPRLAPAAYLIFIPGFISLVYVTVKDFRKAGPRRNRVEED